MGICSLEVQSEKLFFGWSFVENFCEIFLSFHCPMRERLRIRVKKTKRNTIMKHKLPSKVIVLFCVMSMFFLNALGQGKNVTVTVEDIDTYPVGQWRDGYFYFDDSLHGILVSLGR